MGPCVPVVHVLQTSDIRPPKAIRGAAVMPVSRQYRPGPGAFQPPDPAPVAGAAQRHVS